MTTLAEQHLSGAQIQKIENQIVSAVQTRMRDLDLRKWALQTAVNHIGSHDGEELLALASKIHDFITQPERPVTIKIEP